MRKQIAAANWKMNLTVDKAETLLAEIIKANISLAENQFAVFAVPFPYLQIAQQKINGIKNFFIAAQNCYSKKSGAYTGEVSVEMLQSLNIKYVVLGHSERREYFEESNQFLAEKLNIALEYNITPIFCCGEPLSIRDAQTQNQFVAKQLEESLFHFSKDDVQKIVIAYEPIWAIGTGKTATSEQVQEMHAHLRKVLADKFGKDIAENITYSVRRQCKGIQCKRNFFTA